MNKFDAFTKIVSIMNSCQTQAHRDLTYAMYDRFWSNLNFLDQCFFHTEWKLQTG